MDKVILLILIILVSVLIHEYGHFIMARLLRYNPKFILKKENPGVHVEGVNSKDIISISLLGIFFGCISLNSLLFIFSYESEMVRYMNIVYIISCWADIKNIYCSKFKCSKLNTKN